MLWHGRWKTFTRCDYQLPSSVYNLCAFQIQLGFHEKWNFQHSSEKNVFLKVLTKKREKIRLDLYTLCHPYVCSDELTSFSRFFLWATDSHSSIFQDLCSQKISLECIKICYILYRKNQNFFFKSYALLYIFPWLMPAFSWYFSSSTNPAIGKNVCSFTK